MSGIIVPSGLTTAGESRAAATKRLLRGHNKRLIGYHYGMLRSGASVMADRKTVVVHTGEGLLCGSGVALFHEGRLLMAGTRVQTCAGTPFVAALTDLNGAVRLTSAVTTSPAGGVWAAVTSADGRYQAAARTWTGFPTASNICLNVRGEGGSFYEIEHKTPYVAKPSSSRPLPPFVQCTAAIESVVAASRAVYRLLADVIAADPPSFEGPPAEQLLMVRGGSIVGASTDEPLTVSGMKVVYDVERVPSCFALMAGPSAPGVIVRAHTGLEPGEAVIETGLYDALNGGLLTVTVSSRDTLSCATISWRPIQSRCPQFTIVEQLGAELPDAFALMRPDAEEPILL